MAKLTPSQELAKLKKENAALQAKIKEAKQAANGSLARMGVTTKGTAITLYFHGFRFPLTVFPDQFNAIIKNADDIRDHMISSGLDFAE